MLVSFAKTESYSNPPPAFNQHTTSDIEYITPFMSLPNGGSPPAESGVIVNGGNPSVYEAAPPVIPICEATGITFLLPDAANGNVSLLGLINDIA